MTLPTCQELLDFLSDYIADELPSETRSRFDEHLRLCVDCRNYLEDFRITLESAKSAECQMTLPPIPQALVQAIFNSRPRE